MWRKCDLHRHTTPDNTSEFEFDPETFIAECLRDGLEVVAVTDHDVIDHVDAVIEAAKQTSITVIPGIEINTDRGHILALAPGEEGTAVLEDLCNRVPIAASDYVSFDRLTECMSERRLVDNSRFRNHVILIGAHADSVRSILASNQTASLEHQISDAQKLQALEVVDMGTVNEWRRGIKQTNVVMPLLRGSDAHPTVENEERFTWIYLPQVTSQCLRHALATFESSISHESDRPPDTEIWIKSIHFDGGLYDGRRIEFPRELTR